MILHYFEPRRFRLTRASLRYSYLLHPHALLLDLFKEARAILRRGIRGWDDSDVWSMDFTLATLIAQMLRHLASEGMSTPFDFIPPDERGDETNQQLGRLAWKHWLNDRASAFEEYLKLKTSSPVDSLIRDIPPPVTVGDIYTYYQTLQHRVNTTDPLELEQSERLYAARLQTAVDSMARLFEYYPALWD